MNKRDFVKRVVESIERYPEKWLQTDHSGIVYGKGVGEISVRVRTWTETREGVYARAQFRAEICAGNTSATSLTVYGWDAQGIYNAVRRVIDGCEAKSDSERCDRMALLLPKEDS